MGDTERGCGWQGAAHESGERVSRAMGRSNSQAVAPEYNLEEIVSQITQDNRHEECHWGPARGKEVW